MKPTVNKLGQIEKKFNATLISVADEVRHFNNENETEFRPATIKFVDDYGKEQTVSAILYEKSWRDYSMKIGEKYMATARLVDDDVYVNISHLGEIGERASKSMFNFKEEVKNNEFEEVKENFEQKQS